MIPDPFQTAFWEILLELAVIWAGVYLVFRFLQGTRGAGVIRGLGILGVILRVLDDPGGHARRLQFAHQ